MRRTDPDRRRHVRIPAVLGPARTLAYPGAGIARGHSLLAEMGGATPAFQLFNQQSANWCWAAVLQSVLSLKNVRETQSDIVSAHKGVNCPVSEDAPYPVLPCTESHCPNPCNSMHNLRVAMVGRNCFGAVIDLTDRAKALATLRLELSASRPAAARIGQTRDPVNTGHFILISGCQSSGSNPEVQYLCPAPHRSIAAPVTPISVKWNELLNGFDHLSGECLLTHLYTVAV